MILIPKKHRARIKILFSGCRGITENEILFGCSLSSGRNYLTEIERELGIRFKRVRETNPDGTGTHTRYFLSSREDAKKIISLVNQKAKKNKHDGISWMEESEILSLYREKEKATE